MADRVAFPHSKWAFSLVHNSGPLSSFVLRRLDVQPKLLGNVPSSSLSESITGKYWSTIESMTAYSANPGALRSKVRRALATRADVLVCARRAVAHGEQEVLADKEVDFAEIDLVLACGHVQGSHHDEDRIGVGFELGTLMCAMRVFDGQVVELELLLHLLEDLFAGLVKADPHEAARLRQHIADALDFDIACAMAVSVRRYGTSFSISRSAASRTSSRPARTPSIVGRASTSGTMPILCVGVPSG